MFKLSNLIFGLLLVSAVLMGQNINNEDRSQPGGFGNVSETTIFYVDHLATDGANDGSSWENAFTELHSALLFVDTNAISCQIWVAKGTYHPTGSLGFGNTPNGLPLIAKDQILTSSSSSFVIPNNVEVYGGFAGYEDPASFDLADRNFTANETILSGDNGDDGFDDDNSYHVVRFENNDGITVLDGFTVTGGYAFDGEIPNPPGPDEQQPLRDFLKNGAAVNLNIAGIDMYDLCGAGILCRHSSPTLHNLIIKENFAVIFGGGIYLDSCGTVDILNTVIAGNNSDYSGGGITALDVSSINMTNTIISGNYAGDLGGGLIVGNTADGPYNNANIFSTTITGNFAGEDGGGLYMDNLNYNLINSIVWNNYAGSDGHQVYNTHNNYNIHHCNIDGAMNGIYNDAASGNFSDIVNANPWFSDPLNPSDAPTTDGDFHLISGSSAIDAGDNSSVYVDDDLDGEDRIQNSTVELGAYEGSETAIIYIRKDPTAVNPFPAGQSSINNINMVQQWPNYVSDLQTALDSASAGYQIWVARGTYYPASVDRDSSFVIPDDVKVYGGFAGYETDISQRTNFGLGEANETILSGDIGTADDNSDNSYHVVYFDHTNEETLLEGFTITGGRATNGGYGEGGGIYIDRGAPILKNLIIIENYAGYYGGGIYGQYTSAKLVNLVIKGNTTQNDGGGIVFASSGTPLLINILVSGNSVTGRGGGIYFSGVSAKCSNLTISGNSADQKGGGIYCNTTDYKLVNSIIWNNQAIGDGDQIYNNNSTCDISYCDIEGGSSNIVSSGGSESYNNVIDTDPWFIDVVDPNDAPTADGDFHLITGSPCIEAGINDSVDVADDLDGENRIQNSTVDLGAYEGGETAILYVDNDAGGANNGSSWADALNNLQDALDSASAGYQVWVAAGTHYPDEGENHSDGNRSESFTIPNEVRVYGGFDGTESSVDERNLSNNETVLSGDIDEDDDVGGIDDDNSYNVVIMDQTNNKTLLDGFTIRGGYGEILDLGTTPASTDILSSQQAFETNLAKRPNTSTNGNTYAAGGGIHCTHSSANLQNLKVIENKSTFGGGIFMDYCESPVINNVVLSGNYAKFHGGGIYIQYSDEDLVRINNTTISANYALETGGGGLSSYQSNYAIYNSIIWNNYSDDPDDKQIINGVTNYTISNCNVKTQSDEMCDDDELCTGTISNSITADPWFIDVVDPNDAPTADGDFHLITGSACIDAGSNDLMLTGNDLDNEPRPQNTTVDMGAYEGGELGIIYVKRDPGSENKVLIGNSSVNSFQLVPGWVNSVNNLQTALDSATAGYQVWVARGTYYPDEGPFTDNDETASFTIRDQVKVYGGFEGNETSIAQRTAFGFGEANETVLDGEINGDDDLAGNSYQVVYFENAGTGTILDGFTICNGNANIMGSPPDGGGIFCQNSNPLLKNNTLYQNHAINHGGGLYCNNSSPLIENTDFLENKAVRGGGIYLTNCSGVTIQYSSVSGNEVYGGGAGIYLLQSDNLILSNSILSGNHLKSESGGGGAMHLNDNSSAHLFNVTITGNGSGHYGGAIYGYQSEYSITNSIVYNNYAIDEGHQLYNSSTSYNITYTNIEAGMNDIVGSGGGIFTNNIDTDPWFIDVIDPLDVMDKPTTDGDFRLITGSPCINAGINDSVDVAEDLDGEDRIQNSTVDMGAYEGGKTAIIYVKRGGHSPAPSSLAKSTTQVSMPTAWVDPVDNLQTALDSATAGYQVWVANGAHRPDEGPFTDDDRTASFTIRDQVKVYGGFYGDEASITERTDFGFGGTNMTMLSGAIGSTSLTDNSYHVVRFDNVGASTVLDGFVIFGGYADGDSESDYDRGAGIFITGDSSPTIRYIHIEGNHADGYGGGIYFWTSGSPTLTNVTVRGNSAEWGGGIGSSGASPVMTNLIVRGNTANTSGGGFHFSNSAPVVNNAVFAGNTAQVGGGIFCHSLSSPNMTNITVSGNKATNNTGGLYISQSDGVLSNSIIWHNSGSNVSTSSQAEHTFRYSHNNIEESYSSGTWNSALGTNDGGNIDTDPWFVDVLNPADAPDMDGDFHLIQGSPSLNTGSNDSVDVATDLEGENRIQDVTVDMGAYEGAEQTPITYVDDDAGEYSPGAGENSLNINLAQQQPWTPLFEDLQDALETVSAGHEVWVAEGIYYPDEGDNVTDDDKDTSFVVPEGVRVYGGFEYGDADKCMREPDSNLTILSGDIDQQTGFDGNSYHVVVFDHVSDNTGLDGFVIQNGNATQFAPYSKISNKYGGGIYIENAHPVIANCVVENNQAHRGGGLTNYAQLNSSNPRLYNCVFRNNTATYEGGGIYNYGYSNGYPDPLLVNCLITGNRALSGQGWTSIGGGMATNVSQYSVSNPQLVNCTVSGNIADLGGGISNNHVGIDESPNHSEFDVNTELTGRGTRMKNNMSGQEVRKTSNTIAVLELKLKNTILWNNLANLGANEIFNDAGTVAKFYNCNAKGSGGSSNWETHYGVDEGYNIDSDPMFITEIDPNDAPTAEGDFHQVNSPSIDAGNNDYLVQDIADLDCDGNIAEAIPVDLDGASRKFPTGGGLVDLGPYEVQFQWGELIVVNPIPDFEVEVSRRFVQTTIYVGDIFADPSDSTAEITTTLFAIDDSITGRHCCNCCVDTLMFGGVEDDVLHLKYIKYLDGIGTVTLKGESNTFKTGFTEFTVSVISLISDTTNCDDDDTTDVSTDDLADIPEIYELKQNYPNPFNPTTVIPFAIPKASDVHLTLYDINGRKIQSMKAVNLNAGYHKFHIDGSTLPAGIYIYKLQAGDFFEFKKMTLLK